MFNSMGAKIFLIIVIAALTLGVPAMIFKWFKDQDI